MAAKKTQYFINRGAPSEGWQSFPAWYMGIPARGYFLKESAARKSAQRIATARGGPVHLTIVKDGVFFLKSNLIHQAHDCIANATPIQTDGPLGHGWECGVCKTFLQAG